MKFTREPKHGERNQLRSNGKRPNVRRQRTPRRILMTTDTVGGVWNYSLELARLLVEPNVEVILATMGEPVSSAQWRQAREIPNLTVCESQYKLEWMRQSWLDVDEAGVWLLSLEEQFAPDVIHLNNYAHGHLAWRAPCLIVGHSCVFSWHRAVRGCEPTSDWQIYRNRVRKGLRGGSSVIAPSAAMLRELESTYGNFRASLPIHNAGCPDDFAPKTKDPFVMTAGRLWDEAKNVRSLQKIARDLSWPVYAAGGWTNPDDGGNSRHQNVIPLGQLTRGQMSDSLGRASIFALPAFYEPFGLSILEAALSGCALVLGDIPTLRELWDGAAVFVPPSSSERLHDVLEKLIQDPGKRLEYGQRARSRALSYSPQAMRSRYLNLYADLLESCRHSTRRIGLHRPQPLLPQLALQTTE